MNKIYHFLCALCISCAFLSCSTDKLDIEQHGVTTIDTYQSADNDQTLQFIAGVYAIIHGDAYQAVFAGGPACYQAVNYEMARMSGESANYYTYTEGTDAGTRANSMLPPKHCPQSLPRTDSASSTLCAGATPLQYWPTAASRVSS